MAISKAIRISILSLCIVIMLIILSYKYISEGDCAAIVYYEPLTIWDRVIFMAIGIVGLLASVKLTKPNRISTILLSGLFLAISLSFCIFGNQLLEMRTEYWPHEYHPQPIINQQ